MINLFKTILATSLCCISIIGTAQVSNLFRTKERMDKLENFDENKFSWGFFLATNHYDFKLVLDPVYGMSQNKQQNLVHTKGSYSFGAGLMGRMRLNEHLDLRLEPGLQFVQRDLTFNTLLEDLTENTIISPYTEKDRDRTLKSTYIDIPLLVEFHGNRWYNSRAYAATGVNYLINLQSNQGSADDNSLQTFRTTTHNFGWSVEAGIQFYFSRFKLTPGFRGTFFFNNELVKDNPTTPPYWAGAISTAQSRVFMFVLKFE